MQNMYYINAFLSKNECIIVKTFTYTVSFYTPSLTSGKKGPPVSTVVKQNETFCKIRFTPSMVQQAKIATNGMLGDFVVQYDVEREMGIGDIQVHTHTNKL